MADNYYESLIVRIRNLIENEEYEKAGVLIGEEMSMPYVPSAVLKQLESFEKDIRPFLTKEKGTRMMNAADIEKALSSGGEEVFQALDFLNKANIRNYLEVIQNYLLSPAADRLTVSLLIEACQKQQVNTPLSYYHSGHRKLVIPANLPEMFGNETVVRAWQIMTSIFESQNPSFLKLCEQVLVQFVYLNYPEQFETEPDILAYSVIRYVYRAYDDEEGFENFAEALDIDVAELIDIII